MLMSTVMPKCGKKKTAGGLVGGFLKSGERVMRATLSPPVA